MKKLFLTLIACIVAIAANAWTVTYTNTKNWSNVYVYTFGPETEGGWPGKEMTKNGDVYTYTSESTKTPSNIIFNTTQTGANPKQTGNLPFVAGGNYDFDGIVGAQKDTYTVYLKNEAGWENVYVYTWGPEAAGTWPGTKLSKNSEGLYYWNYESTVKPSFDGIKFNAGGDNMPQTDDLAYEPGKVYSNAEGANLPEKAYLFGGAIKGWVTDAGVEMTKTSAGVFTANNVTVSKDNFSIVTQLMDEAGDWNINNYRYGPEEDNTPSVVGTNAFSKNENSWSITAGTYNFTVDFNSKTLTISVGGDDEEGDYPEALYFLANIDGSSSWDVPGLEFDNEGDGFYTLKGINMGGENGANSYFALTTNGTNDWDAIDGNRYGPANDGAEATADTELSFSKVKGTSWQIGPAKYDISVSWDDMTITLEKVGDYEPPTGTSYKGWWFNFLCSSYENWKAEGVEGTKDSSEVKFGHEVVWEDNTEFLVKIYNGKDDIYYTYNDVVPVGKWVELSEREGETGGNMTSTATAGVSYNIYWNFETASIKIIDAATDGVAGIDTEAGEAVYYNLQGQKIANPDKGIYVKVVNGKAVKVIK